MVFIGCNHFFTPRWAVSRALIHTHIQMSIPKSKDVHKNMNLGKEIHLYAPIANQQEKWIANSWFDYCNTQLAHDDVILPFYEKYIITY